MFFIVNKTKGSVTLGDLGITLGPRQAIDLDKIMQRSKSEASRALKTAKAKGDIEIRVKDEPRSRKIPNTKARFKTDFKGMKDSIIGEMKDTMKELLKERGGVSKEDLQDVTQALLDAMSKKTTETIIIRQDGENMRQDEEVEMDENVLGEMNKRAVNKMVENVESVEIRYEEEKQKNDLMENVNELENLLD